LPSALNVFLPSAGESVSTRGVRDPDDPAKIAPAQQARPKTVESPTAGLGPADDSARPHIT